MIRRGEVSGVLGVRGAIGYSSIVWRRDLVSKTHVE